MFHEEQTLVVWEFPVRAQGAPAQKAGGFCRAVCLPWAPRPLPECSGRPGHAGQQLPCQGATCGLLWWGFVSLPRARHSRQAPTQLSEAIRRLLQGRVSFKPSMDQQRSCPTCTDSLLHGDFIITYDVNRESPANVQVRARWLCWAAGSSVAPMRWGLV